MKQTLNILLILMIGLSLGSCHSSRTPSDSADVKAKNVILLIGDGMGLPHVYSAMTVAGVPLNIERTTVTGLQKTYSSDNYVTDSGAAGTAIATGKKTYNGAIGVDSTGSPVRTILEIAEENKLATGLVSSSSVTHATPASFIAHQGSRSSYEDIAADFLRTDIDVFIGGGYDHFAKRADKLNLTDTLLARGYDIATTMEMVMSSNSDKLAGLVYPAQPPYRLKGRGNMLPDATARAIEILSKNPRGFFLMVEGSQIDWAAHAHAADTLVDETLDFDRAVGKAIDFAAKDGRTLVIVTGDHETGGVTITGGSIAGKNVRLEFSTTGHSAVMVPVYAFGPGADLFSGIYENTDLFEKILSAYKFKKQE